MAAATAFEANQHCQWLQAAQARLQPIGRRAVRASAPAVPLTARPAIGTAVAATATVEVAVPSPPVERPRTRTSNVMLQRPSPPSQVSVLACGVGGLEELCRQLDDRTVAWALLRFQVGGGSFVRTKMVLIQLNGTRTPALQRGLLNARSKEVLRELGEVNASLQVTSGKELTLDYLCERLLPFFSTDHMEYSLQALKSEYENMVELTQQRALETATAAALSAAPGTTPPATAARAPRGSRTQRRSAVQVPPSSASLQESLEMSLDQALVEVAEEGTFYNWLLLEPLRMSCHKAHLVDDRVLFGLLRLTFGGAAEGRHGLTKHVLIHWVGPQVGAVRRGLCGAKYGEVSALFGGYCSVAFRHEANQLSDLRLEEIILKLQRLTVVDSVSGDGVAARISLEEYNMARAEELRRQEAQRTAAKTEPKRPKQVLQVPRLELEEEPPAKAESPALPDLKTALRIVRDPKGHINWVLCGLPSRLPPSPCRAFAQMEVRSLRSSRAVG